jgi:uncharacterized protein (TIGR00375 family)
VIIADFHIHSKYSRATSPDCSPEPLDLWARKKGLSLIGTGDCTHAVWREELKEKLTPAEEGLYTLRDEYRRPKAPDTAAPRFIVTGEISSIYKKNGRVRKVHNLILLPGLREAEILSKMLEERGCNLKSDGRPILGLSSRDLLEITLEACPAAVFIPAHIWTPHFSLFGAYSGYDTIEECFEDLTPHIHALETGLSSDPPMNWRLSALDRYALVSNSDAHSPAKLAREANLFDTALSYPAIAKALTVPDSKEFLGTIEFFPEEGKYHFDGHRNCKVCQKPSVTREMDGICPVCGKKITVGVLHRVEELADRVEGFKPPAARRFESLVPLREVVASAMGKTPASKKVEAGYESLLEKLGPELFILRKAPLADIERSGGACLAEAVRRLRCKEVDPSPGYDGAYGKVSILSQSDLDALSGQFCFPGLEVAQKTEPADRPPAPGSLRKPAAVKTGKQPPLKSLPYGLNEQQWQAASSGDPAVCVLAGPGTGKTKTLVSRIAFLVEQCGVPPETITAVTFTNKAASEMRERLCAHFGSRKIVSNLTIGTFHAVCLKILGALGEPSAVLDEFGAQAILADILSDLDMMLSARDALREISKIKNGNAGSVPNEVFRAYESQLAQNGLLDFDDILLRVLDRYESAGSENLPRPAHLLVDEFQDVGVLQYRLVRAFSRGGKGLFVIGDPDQSIYGFRGADARCFETLAQDLPHTRRIRLSKNYRSTPQIIGCALPVLKREAAWLSACREDGGPVRLVGAKDPFSQALFITKEIGRMVGGIDLLAAHTRAAQKNANPKGFSDIAVLYRTHRQAEVIAECLGIEGIPYTVAGRDEFLSDPYVRSALAFFDFLLNPAGFFSLQVCLQSAKINPEDRKHILKSYSKINKKADALARILREEYPSPEAFKLAGQLENFSSRIKKEKPGKQIERWIESNALGGNPNMQRLHRAAVMNTDIPSFLNNLTLGQEGDVVRSGSNKRPPDAVTLSTLHGAKGLEFPVVFLMGATDGIIPLKAGGRAVNTEEEKRLFYVGLTRAKEELVVLHTPDPSPFLTAFPSGLRSLENASGPRPPKGKQLGFDF